METSVIDLLVPTDIQVDDAENNTSKITLEPLERGFWSHLRKCIEKNTLIIYAWFSYNRCHYRRNIS